MGQQQSKDELLYEQVNYGNAEGIKALCRDGAGLEWIDKEGKTPLIAACMKPELYHVASTLIQLGANVNSYRPGRQAGTPLHHAAKRGLERTVKLLLSHGANALLMNDDCQTPLDVARAKGYSNVVRALESHICLFSGWLREFFGPGFLEVLAPQLLSRKVWVVVLPCGSRNLKKPFKLELVLYSSMQDAQPRTVIPLWRANLEEPKTNQLDPSVMIVDNSTKTRVKLAPVTENDRQQLQWFCNACKGIPQAQHPVFLQYTGDPVGPATAPPAAEDLDLAMALSASIEASSSTDWNTSLANSNRSSSASYNPTFPTSSTDTNEKRTDEAGPSCGATPSTQLQNENSSSGQTMIHTPDSIPSAPPILNETIEDGPIHYPSIDSSPINVSSTVEHKPTSEGKEKNDEGGSSCVICLDALVEGACIPCGHMAGCMSCLNEVKGKKWGCPVCRSKIDQVVRLYAV